MFKWFWLKKEFRSCARSFSLSLPLINSFNKTEAVIYLHAGCAFKDLPLFLDLLHIFTNMTIDKILNTLLKVNLDIMVF